MPFKHYKDIETFDRLYREALSECDSNRDAYLKVEEKYEERFGRSRYSNFISFKNAYSRRHKK